MTEGAAAEPPQMREPAGRAARLGADTDAVLRALGYDDARLKSLRDAGVI